MDNTVDSIPQNPSRSIIVIAWEFAIHVIVGAAAFVLIAAIAIGFNLAVKWLQGIGISEFVLIVITALEYGLFVIDCLLFIAFMFKAVAKFLVELRHA